jgi:hypothetical protein
MTQARTKVHATVKIGSIHFLTVDLDGQFALLSQSSLCNLRPPDRVFAISQPFNDSNPL